ncbi:MAG: GlxA family transcriptional regulator [Alphaproteobacteria bacterium]|nr:GlxA family transcriptional regulator [Alphaproteobacteria bacterium]
MLFGPQPGNRPLVVDLVLASEFSLLSLAATMEPLRAANRVSGETLYKWRLLSEDGRPALTSSGVPIPVAGRFEARDVRDVLILVAAFEPERNGAPLLARLRQAARAGTPIGGIESGGWIMARAGLLDGRRATTHWEDIDEFARRFPAVDVVVDRYVVDGDRFTTGGATPALDLMLHMVRAQHGIAVALDVASVFIYDQERLPSEPQRIVSVGRLAMAEPKLAAAIRLMESTVDEPLRIADLARRMKMSSRGLQKLFRRRLDMAPHAYFMELRLATARRLLLQSRRSVLEVALASGFASATSFSRAFARRYGRSPRAVRRAG